MNSSASHIECDGARWHEDLGAELAVREETDVSAGEGYKMRLRRHGTDVYRTSFEGASPLS